MASLSALFCESSRLSFSVFTACSNAVASSTAFAFTFSSAFALAATVSMKW